LTNFTQLMYYSEMFESRTPTSVGSGWKLRGPSKVATFALLAVLLLVTTIASPAHGIAYSGSGIYWTIDSSWNVSGINLESQTSASATTAVWNIYGPTDLSPSWQTGICSGTIDLCIYDIDLGDTGYFGIAECTGTVSGLDPQAKCSRHRVRINLWSGAPAGVAKSTYNLCHEIGHAVALRHWNNSATCLRRWVDGGSAAQITQTERGELNGHY
jgi:hypothetical protein